MRGKPNLLLITSDQHRGDCFGFEGRPVKTPHLDRLASTGPVLVHALRQVPCASRLAPVC